MEQKPGLSKAFEEVLSQPNSNNSVFCRKQDKNVQRDNACKKCPEYNPLDYHNLFNKCRIQETYFTSLYPSYKKIVKKQRKEEISHDK